MLPEHCRPSDGTPEEYGIDVSGSWAQFPNGNGIRVNEIKVNNLIILLGNVFGELAGGLG